MKIFLLSVFSLMVSIADARPVVSPTLEELNEKASVVVIIKPESIRQTKDRPDDESFGTRDLANYHALETTCKVITTFKGTVTEKNIKIVHFAYAEPKPEFNGGILMSFLFYPTQFVIFPRLPDGKPDLSVGAYGFGIPEYLAYLRRLPDGRYAAVSPQYDAAISFRVLVVAAGAQRYHFHPAAKPAEETKK